MHAVTYAVKRANLRSLALLHRELKPFACLGVTPARVDLLNLIRTTYPYRLLQREIPKCLGVSAATISRMLKALETLGLVRRERHDVDRRMNDVRLSRKGKACMRIILREIVDARVVDHTIRRVLRGAPGDLRRHHAAFLSSIRAFASRLGDTSTCSYVARALGDIPWKWPWPSIRAGEDGD